MRAVVLEIGDDEVDRLIVETTDETKERDKDEVVAVLVAEDLDIITISK